MNTQIENLERVVISIPFPGNAQTFINKDGKIAYHENETIEEYLTANPSMKVVTWDEYNELHEAFFKKPLCEITEEEYMDMLECLPPLNWHNVSKRYNVFFCSEAMSGIFNGLYVYDRKTGKYYAGTKSRFLSDAQILAEIENDIK